MKKQFHFYALKPDMLSLLGAAEQQKPLRYTKTGNLTKPDFLAYRNGLSIPNLGEACRPAATLCDRFLITPSEISANIEVFDASGGVRRYLVDQRLNQDSVTIQLSGVWDGRIIISGSMGTVSNTPIAKGLMKQFDKAFRAASFAKVGHYLVGPDALEFLKQGGRLTPAEQCPPDLDLKLA